MHIQAGLERRTYLLGHGDLCPSPWVSLDARSLLFDREHTKVAQLHTIPSRQGGRDGAQDRVDDLLHIPAIQVWVLGRDPLNQFGLEHRSNPKKKRPEGAGLGQRGDHSLMIVVTVS